MIKTNSSFAKKDNDGLVFDKNFFDKYQDKQIIAYSKPNSYRPTMIILLYSEGDSVICRWPNGYEQFFKKNEEGALKFLREHAEFVGGIFERDQVFLDNVLDANNDVPRQYKYQGNAFVQVAWCDYEGQIYIGNRREMVESFKTFLQDEAIDESTRHIVERFLKEEKIFNSRR